MHVEVVLTVLAGTVEPEAEALSMGREVGLQIGFPDFVHVRK